MSDFAPPDRSSIGSKWSRVAAKPGESCRWESIDGRWVALSVGSGVDLGYAFVTCSDGRKERGDSFEHALALAKSWRT